MKRRSSVEVRWRYNVEASLPGLTRQSIIFVKVLAKKMDARVISAFPRVFDALLRA